MDKNWVKDIYTKGFVILKEPGIKELINLPDDFQLLNKEERLRDNGEKDLPPEINDRFKLVGHYLKTKYIDPVWSEATFKKYIVWDGVDKDNQYWHTDVFEDMNVFFLYYMDDTQPETGGGISFKWGENVYQHQPKAGDLILVSNKRGFFHKADATNVRRRVASFDYLVVGEL